MRKINWKIQFSFIKAHVGILRNELADALPKKAVKKADIIECYKKVPKSLVISELSERSLKTGKENWTEQQRDKSQNNICRQTDRLNTKIKVTHNCTFMVTGHGNARSYLHRFKIIEPPICPCGTKDQTIDHLLFECELLYKEIDNVLETILKTDGWPTIKKNLIHLLNLLTKNHLISSKN